jgi:hypothetical protein
METEVHVGRSDEHFQIGICTNLERRSAWADIETETRLNHMIPGLPRDTNQLLIRNHLNLAPPNFNHYDRGRLNRGDWSSEARLSFGSH